jgi:hypothetical protein
MLRLLNEAHAPSRATAEVMPKGRNFH